MEKIIKRNKNYKIQRKQFKLWIDFNNNMIRFNKLIKNANKEKTINIGVEVRGYLSSVKKRAINSGYNRQNRIYQIIKHHQSFLGKMDVNKTGNSIKELYRTTSTKYNRISKYL